MTGPGSLEDNSRMTPPYCGGHAFFLSTRISQPLLEVNNPHRQSLCRNECASVQLVSGGFFYEKNFAPDDLKKKMICECRILIHL
ncbi:MAG: hypothetical protein EOM37_16090 [Proteobacteria bacterium]|nr:hypothetical protein [Pseudomonadota bacterium]